MLTKTPRPSRSSGSEAYDLLLEAIETGALSAGTRLRESELADRFRISRTPVREALKRLEAQGLVLHEPHHGAVVARLDYSQMIELYHMREVLEGTAAGLAATQATATELEILREMVVRDEGLLGEPAALAATNRIFHRQIGLSARNRYLNTMLENMRLSLALLSGTTLGVPDRGAESVKEHAAIVAAIEARDPAAAERAARMHIRNAFKVRVGLTHEPIQRG
jgi:DNA-binding GntR family transcriptional regulator